MQLGRFTEYDQDIFTITEGKTRPYEYPDRIHLSISYEFDLNKYRINRDVYNVLDWLGDVGGLRDALILIGTFIMFFYTKIRGDALDKFLLQSFFVTEKVKSGFFKKNKIVLEP